MNSNRAGPRKNAGGEPGDQPRRDRPGLALAARLTGTAGPGERYPGCGDDAVVVAAGRWDAIESWAYARKLAAVRELVRRRPAPGAVTRVPGAVPTAWRKDLAAEVACELGITGHAAETLASLAIVLETRLPLTAAALDAGILNPSKARLIADETAVLTDEQARHAEADIAGRWEGQTWAAIRDLITRAVINADPEAAARRRERAEKEDARVRFFREHAGTCGLAGYGLPADQALLANQALCARARAYRAWGIAGTMEQLRVLAFLDLLTGRDARRRYPRKTTPARKGTPQAGTPYGDGQRTRGNAGPGQDQTSQDQTSQDEDDRDSLLHDEPADDGDGQDGYGQDDEDQDGEDGGTGDGPGDGGAGPGGDGPGPAGPAGPGADDGLAANVDLIIPLADLTGYGQRAGQAPALGALDPDLARRLAARAARNPASSFRIILTGPGGHAIGFGQATRTPRRRRPRAAPPPAPSPGTTGNLPGQPGMPLARFTPAGTGPQGGYGTWTLETGGTAYRVRLHPVQVSGPCEHRYESGGYQPGPVLRRLVQVRDGECMFPGCARPAGGSEFEHAVPWPAGRSCACNGGIQCHHHNLLKQDLRWAVRQDPGGSRTWTTPAGLTYTKSTKQYPT